VWYVLADAGFAGGTEEERDEGVEGDEEEASAEGPVKRKVRLLPHLNPKLTATDHIASL